VTVFVSRHRSRKAVPSEAAGSAAAGAAFTPLATAAASFLLGLELSPASGLLRLQLGGGAVLEGLVVFHQVEANAVDAVGSVDGGLDFGLTPVEGVEEGDGDGGVVEGSAVAHLEESVTEGGVAVLG